MTGTGPEPESVDIDLVRLRAGLEAVIELLPIGPEHARPCSALFGGLEWADVCEAIVNDVWNTCSRRNRWPEVREHLERARAVIDWALHDSDLPPEVPPEYQDRFNTRIQVAQVEYDRQAELGRREAQREQRKQREGRRRAT